MSYIIISKGTGKDHLTNGLSVFFPTWKDAYERLKMYDPEEKEYIIVSITGNVLVLFDENNNLLGVYYDIEQIKLNLIEGGYDISNYTYQETSTGCIISENNSAKFIIEKARL